MKDTCTSRVSNDTIEVSSLLNGRNKFLFSIRKLNEHRRRIASMLSELDNDLMQTDGCACSGRRWIAARYLRSGEQWAYCLEDVDRLLAVGRAAGMVSVTQPIGEDECCIMPYATVMKLDVMNRERLLPSDMQNRSVRYWSF